MRHRNRFAALSVLALLGCFVYQVLVGPSPWWRKPPRSSANVDGPTTTTSRQPKSRPSSQNRTEHDLEGRNGGNVHVLGARSLDRLSHFLNLSSKPTVCPTDSVTMEATTTSNFTYVHCGNLGTPNNPPLLFTPRSMLQCPDFQPLLDNQDLTIVPRDDWFDTASSSDSETARMPTTLGSVHFHHDSSQSSRPRMRDVEVLLRKIKTTPLAMWYGELSGYLANVLQCTCHGTDCQCPEMVPNTATTNATLGGIHRAVVDQDASGAAWGVHIANFFPAMYQLPTLSTVPSSRVSSLQSTDHADPAATMVDPVTPSVAVFRQAYAEMEKGRVLVQTRPYKHCVNHARRRGQSDYPNRLYLVQFNQCFVKWSENDRYVTFRLPITVNTLVETSGAKVFDKVILLTAFWSTTFYHATVENLPRLLLLQDFIEVHPNIPILVCQSPSGDKEKTLLHIFAKIWGLEQRMIFLKPTEVIYANLIYIPEPTPCGQLQPLMARAAQSAILQKIQSRRQQPTAENAIESAAVQWQEADNWIVVIRRRHGRSIRNHDAMMAALQSTFPNETCYVFDDATVPPIGIDQWAVFAHAKIVIAPHGGGLCNILASRPGTHIVEFYGQGTDCNLCYMHLAVALNMHHHPLHMESLDAKGTYEVNVARVVGVVRNIVQNDIVPST
jgi:Glycosyltransferase 61